MTKFIDTHSHVLPYCDDGAADWKMAMDMLKQAEQDGIIEIVCTPHVLSSKDLNEEKKFIDLYEELKKRARDAGISIKLHMGSELYVQPDFQLDRRIATVANNGRYFLIEFPMAMIPESAARHVFDNLPTGKTPIIVHPERNGSVMADPNTVLRLVRKGALLQVTAGSFTGNFGDQAKTTANILMQANAVHLAATDAHENRSRTLKLKKAYEVVCEKWGQERAELLFYENPRRVIAGDLIEFEQPELITDSTKAPFWEKFKLIFSRKD